jgi:DNA polymerase III alpha subunit
MGQFVNAYSADLGEELDQQRVVVGGIVTETRKVITKARTTMGVVTLEDLQGSVSVIVFPKVLELTEGVWAEDAILLVAGRVDHKGDETVLLADTVWAWEEATALGPDAFARAVARDDRGRRNGNGNGHARLPVAYQDRNGAAPAASTCRASPGRGRAGPVRRRPSSGPCHASRR